MTGGNYAQEAISEAQISFDWQRARLPATGKSAIPEPSIQMMTNPTPCLKCGSFERRPRGNCAQCHREAAARYRARLKAAGGTHTEAEWLSKAETYATCPKCSRLWQDVERPKGQRLPFTKGHIVALARGGTNGIDNLQPECARCNYADHGAQLTRLG